MAEKFYEVMTDTWGWGDPHQFVRGDVVEEEDASGFDVPWAVNMGSVRPMTVFEVRSLEARENDDGYNPHRNPVTGLLSTVRMFEEEAEARDEAGVLVDEFQEGQPMAIPGGGGTGVDQVKLENARAGLTGKDANESTSSGPKASSTSTSSSSSSKEEDDKK